MANYTSAHTGAEIDAAVEAGKSPGRTLATAMAQQGGTIVQVGDSNTDDAAGRPGWQTAVDIEWTGSRAPLYDWTDNNIGQNGSTLQAWVSSISTGNSGTAVTTRGSAWAAVNANPDIIVVSLGTNDMGLDSVRATSGSETTFRSNLSTLINFFLDNSSAAILLRLPQPFAYEAFTGVTWTNADEAATMSARMRSLYLEWVGAHPRVSVYDSHADLFGLRIDDKATDALDPVSGGAMMSDCLHPTELGFRRFAQRLAQMMVPSLRREHPQTIISNAQHVVQPWAVPVRVTNTEVSGTLLTILTDPKAVMFGALAYATDKDSPVGVFDWGGMDAAFAFGKLSAYHDLRSAYAAPDVKIYFPGSGNTYTCTTFRLNTTVTGSGGEIVDKYSITGTSITETGLAVVYVEDVRYAPSVPPDLITVPVDRTTPDIFVPFSGKRGMRAEITDVTGARISGAGVTGSCDVYLVTVNNGVSTGTLAFSVAFGAGLLLGTGTANATNYPSGVLLTNARVPTQLYGLRITNFSNFGTSGKEGHLQFTIRYYT